MKTTLLAIFVLQFVTCWSSVSVRKGSRHRVLLVSLDGFPHQALAQQPWEHLTWLYAHGSHPHKFINQFPTKSFPNHFSVATGLYEEAHGVVGNTVFDPSLNRTFTIHDHQFFTQNPGVMPLWTLNEQHGGHSGCIGWPGCDFTYHGTNVTFWEHYQSDSSITKNVDKVLEWFTHVQTPANLVFLYCDQPDVTGHVYGPNSSQFSNAIKKIDAGLGYLFHKLDLHGLKGEVDVLVFSDHGMAQVSEHTGIIDLDTVVDPALYSHSGTSPVLNIWPVRGKDLSVYSKLREGSSTHRFRVYLKEDPQMVAWHYWDNPRISSIILVADVGYVFEDFRDYIKAYHKQGYPEMTELHGTHGYSVDSPSMEPIFVAVGPSFKQKYAAEDFSNLDVYPLVCLLLGLPPGPNNGSLATISTILAQPVASRFIQPLLIALVCLAVLGGVIATVACVLSRRDKHRPVSADALINGYVYRKTMQKEKKTVEDISEEECLLEDEGMEIV